MAKSGPRHPVDTDGASAQVKARLIEAAIVVLARDGYAHASARAIASQAGSANGLIYYHFGSMDALFAATARTLATTAFQRIKVGLGGDDAATLWPQRLGDVIRSEAVGDHGQAVLELMVGARGSPALQAEIAIVVDEALDFIRGELDPLIDGSPIAQLLPAELIAESAGATFLGLELLVRLGRGIDIDRLAATVALALTMFATPADTGSEINKAGNNTAGSNTAGSNTAGSNTAGSNKAGSNTAG